MPANHRCCRETSLVCSAECLKRLLHQGTSPANKTAEHCSSNKLEAPLVCQTLGMKTDFTKEDVVDMAQTVQDLDKKEHTERTIFSRLEPADCGHLKPLSVYSRLITCDKMASPHQLSNPFINFKIEVMNICEKKRKLDHSDPDDGYETPKKKVFHPKDLSPDHGCFVDSNSPPARQDSVSPFAMSKPALLHEIKDGRSEFVCRTSGSEHGERGTSTELGENKVTAPHSIKRENVLVNIAPAFDCDVDNILCLSPFGTHNVGQHPDNVESCKRPSSCAFQKQPVLIPTAAHGERFQGGDGQVKEEREEMKKEMYVDFKDVEEDKGYFSMSYIKDLKTGKDSSQLPSSTSSPMFRRGDFGAPECHLKNSSELACHKQVELSGQHVSFTGDDFCPVVSGPLLESGNSPAEILEGHVEEVWDIGLPILESSVCEQSRQVPEEVQGGVLQSVHVCQSKLVEEESTLDTSYETTLPLQVKVKSVVVRPDSKTAAPPLPNISDLKEDRVTQTARSHRPVISHSEVDLERDKRMYLHSVARHLNENPGGERGVTIELTKLMTHVADQTPGSNGRRWQHPSDFTRRNYQRRFGGVTPTMTLQEWQATNCPTLKRFAHIPKIFKRSPFP